MKLENKRVAILSATGYEKSELEKPKQRLKDEGAEVVIVSLEKGKIKGMTGTEWDGEQEVDKLVADAKSADFDGLVIPGGVINPDKLRTDEDVLSFIKSFFEEDKPVAAICHGPQVLIDAKLVEGRTMTSYKAIENDLKNAGANWKDEEVVVDGNLITSRKPKDIPAFNDKIVELLAK
ncbi:MAG: type 1 glutamine amidotransferase domain-containing protein [Weeksellaceae bacterium]|nr:type 1 glutamine amidotransferase domain-containing protein [Weeksellaceae bacterium]